MVPTKNLVLVTLIGLLVQSQALAETIESALNGVEQTLEAKVGFYLHDFQSNETLEHAADSRFPMNSTFKLFACGALLSRVDAGKNNLSESVDLQGVELVPWSPSLAKLINSGHLKVSLDSLCRMMLSVSDNTAANLILKEIGGPEGFTAFMRSIGDDVTRLDRWEIALNEGVPNDPRDTTSPKAIAQSLKKLLLSDFLSNSSRETLREWLSGHRVADNLFRASLPESWAIEDRTGAGRFGTRGIVAVMYPPEREPILATLFIRDTDVGLSQRDAAIARIGRAIVERVASN